MPLIGFKVTGGLDFSGYFLTLKPDLESHKGSCSAIMRALKKAGVLLLGYGEFVTVAGEFLLDRGLYHLPVWCAPPTA